MSPGTRIRIVTIALVLLAWEALAWSGLVFQGVVPSSLTVLASAARQLSEGEFYGHLWRSSQEIGLGFVIGSVVGIAVGTAMGLWVFFGGAVQPFIHVLAPTPKIVFLPVLMILFGVDMGSKIAMGAISAFFPVVVTSHEAIRLVPQVLIHVGRSFQASRRQMITKIYFPAMLPAVTTGMRLGLGVAIIGTLLAEIKLSNRGLGFLAIQQYDAFRIPDLYAVLLLIFSLAVAANMLIGRLSRRLNRRSSANH
ncbi:MAG: ABC transporter permease [Betaproteobacteria bacterium]|nr:ABC transporter permease [Betaproteobacteria bacterium]